MAKDGGVSRGSTKAHYRREVVAWGAASQVVSHNNRIGELSRLRLTTGGCVPLRQRGKQKDAVVSALEGPEGVVIIAIRKSGNGQAQERVNVT